MKANLCKACGCTNKKPCTRSTTTGTMMCRWINKRHTLCSFCATPLFPTGTHRLHGNTAA